MLPKVRYGRPTASVVEIVSDSDSDGEPPLKVYRVNGRRSHLAATLLGISGKEYRHMKRVKVPKDFLQLLHYLHCKHGWLEQVLDIVEYFAGLGKVKKAGASKGLSTRAYEILHDHEVQNFLGDSGFATAIAFAKELRSLSMNHWGTVCSSWV